MEGQLYPVQHMRGQLGQQCTRAVLKGARSKEQQPHLGRKHQLWEGRAGGGQMAIPWFSHINTQKSWFVSIYDNYGKQSSV